MTRFLMLMIPVLLCFTSVAQQFQWAATMGGTVLPGDRGESIRTDAAGNVITAGGFYGTADFDPGPGTFYLTASPDVSDIFIQKLDASGNFLWAKGISGIGSATAYSIDLDAAGNIVVTGYFWGVRDFDPGPNAANLSSSGMADIFVLKLDNGGNFLWAKSMGGTASEGGLGLDVDHLGNIVAVGRYQGAVDFDPGPNSFILSPSGNFDLFILKLGETGNFLWAKSIGGPGYDDITSVCTDLNGNTIITGSFAGIADMDPGAGVLNFTALGNDIFVLKLAANGNLIWARHLKGDLSSMGSDIVVDAAGNIFYTGWFGGTVDFDPGTGITNMTSSSGSRDIFVSRLTPDGLLDWINVIGGPAGDESFSIFLDANSHLYLTGNFSGNVDFHPGPGTFMLSSQNGNEDIFILKLDASGSLNWAVAAGGSENDKGYSIAVHSNGSIVTTGYFRGTADLDPGPNAFTATAAGGDDIFVLRLSQLTTGIGGASNPFQVIAFPNPANGLFYISTRGANNKNIDVEILDYSGRRYSRLKYKASSNDHKQPLNLSGAPPGIYIVNLTIGGKNYQQTVILQR